MHLARVGFDADVADTGVGERRREVAGAAADVEQRAAGRGLAVGRPPQVADHRRGVGRQRAVEAGRVGLLVAELGQQPQRPGAASPVARRRQ